MSADENEVQDVINRIHGQNPLRKYSVAEVKEIVYALISQIDRSRDEVSDYREACRNHEGLCCPSGDAHDFSSRRERLADEIKKGLKDGKSC